jgi:hypothetical protein
MSPSRLLLLLVLVILIITGIYSVVPTQAQDPMPTDARFHSADELFPGTGLVCPEFDELPTGPSWEAVTIGISTQNEFEAYLSTLGPYSWEKRKATEGGNSTKYLLNARWEDQQIPTVIGMCVQDDVVSVLAMATHHANLVFEDFIMLYGIPDTVTWTHQPYTRVAFWFERGIAAEVFAATPGNSAWGRVSTVVYFPPQSTTGHEDRWPYNRTWGKAPVDLNNEGIAVEENPFLFSATIGAMTARPSFTPSPTFTPAPIASRSVTPIIEATSAP